jgi:hypothetical protein
MATLLDITARPYSTPLAKGRATLAWNCYSTGDDEA